MLEAIKDRNAVIPELLAAGKVSHLWTGEGPSPEALRIRDSSGEGVSPGVHTWVLLAFEVFSGTGQLTISRMFDTLEETDLLIALSLLDAAVDGGTLDVMANAHPEQSRGALQFLRIQAVVTPRLCSGRTVARYFCQPCVNLRGSSTPDSSPGHHPGADFLVRGEFQGKRLRSAWLFT